MSTFVTIIILIVYGILQSKEAEIFKSNSISHYFKFYKQQEKCMEKSFEIPEQKSNFIFSGTVRELRDNLKTFHIKPNKVARVDIKRIYKGNEILDKIPVQYSLGKYSNINHRTCYVEGFGSLDICFSDTKLHDTWIIFAKYEDDRLVLTSSLVKLSLENIIKVETTVKKTKDPCGNMKCLYGSVCTPLKDNKSYECTCLVEKCHVDINNNDKDIVCGEDGREYSQCFLKLESCLQQREIKVLNLGPCKDLCKNKKCPYYSECKVNNQREVSCQCQQNCSQIGEKICGSDNNTYSNLCLMQRASCLKKKNIELSHYGSCKKVAINHLCNGVKCKFDGKCKQGKCSCPLSCPNDENPVCGTDGTSYINECSLFSAACNSGSNLKVAKKGNCEDELNPEDICNSEVCLFGSTCDISNFNGIMRPRCVCLYECEEETKNPVCGSDNRIYGSDCQMHHSSCLTQTNIEAQPTENCANIFEEFCHGLPSLKTTNDDIFTCSNTENTCPTGTFCHIIEDIGRCCNSTQIKSDCQFTEFGCCIDGISTAHGLKLEGCQNMNVNKECNCHMLGSMHNNCSSINQKCKCKPYVSGDRCDRCEPGFWGFLQLAKGKTGCIECVCDPNGSIREDCDQTTGQCMCEDNYTGLKCQYCKNGSKATKKGCTIKTARGLFKSFKTTVILIPKSTSLIQNFISTKQIGISSISPVTMKSTTPLFESEPYTVPFFSGYSFVEMKPVNFGNHDMSIEIKFKSLSNDGLIFYYGKLESIGKQEYALLALNNGSVEFKYDLGSGSTTLKSQTKIQLRETYKVTAIRHGKDSLLKINGIQEKTGVSPGQMRFFNTGKPIYLGTLPNLNLTISENYQIRNGFQGCISLLKISSSEKNREYELLHNSNDIVRDHKMRNCNINSCITDICINEDT